MYNSKEKKGKKKLHFVPGALEVVKGPRESKSAVELSGALQSLNYGVAKLLKLYTTSTNSFL